MKAQRPGDILLVDSDQKYLESIGAVLQQAEHRVTCSLTTQQAEKMLAGGSFEVVLCSRNISGGSGDALCNYIKAQTDLSGIVVGLLVEGNQEVDWRLDAPVSGAGLAMSNNSNQQVETPPDDLISKRATAAELLLRVQGLLRQRRYLEEIQNSVITLTKIAEGIEEQDKRARGHCQRISIMAVQLGAVLGCDDWQLTTLERAGYLHDIGKVCIPGAIIDKSQPLSPREMEIIRDHCILGEKLCSEVAALRPVLPVIRHHHERSDGTGYPDGLRGDQIPVLAQIFSIVDIYDAMRMWRPFRPPMNEVQAIDVMRQEVARGFWNRYIFTAFEQHVLTGLEERLDALHILWPRF